MPERDSGQDISEETRRLIEDLGRLSEQQVEPTTDSMRSLASAYGMPQPAADERLAEVEAEIGRVEAELRQLEAMREYLQRDVLDRRRRALLARPLVTRGREAPHYLRPVLTAIVERRPGSFWLHGEDARERRRAIDIIMAAVEVNRAISRHVVKVDFVDDARASRRGQANAELAYGILEAWRSWVVGRRPYSLMASLKPLRMHARRRDGLALILSELPARRRQTAPFLTWLRGELSMFGSLLLVVSTDALRNDAADLGFEAIESENPWARFGRRLASLRLRKGWNRQRLASETGFPLSYLAMLEGGLHERVTPAVVRRVSRVLDVPVDELADALPSDAADVVVDWLED